MNKEEQRKIQVCLVVNAIVKFNLYPPKESVEWHKNIGNYELTIDDLLPDPTGNTFYRDKMCEQFYAASTAKTVSDKLLIYDELSILTGFPLQALAGPVLPKMDINTLTGRCLYTFFNTRELQCTQIPPELTEIIAEWQEFFDSQEPCYFWEETTYTLPWTTNKIAAAFCMQLKEPESNDLALSCLYGLAVALDRKDIKAILDEHNITTKNLSDDMQQAYQDFLSTKKILPVNENIIVEPNSNHF